ncbi:helix-turn-helix domain-containing protein [Virgibacillus sp. C22-A2]|uniref:Helix-turn-helix domain-containing protein n=1 Tax=Virgibacillus tibetensis TaxID=3042313 RepID=A0ABU6KC82_9BACI|nr:helix-turn-helix domain-containing protein [Virgibacillus sp. C22-A2]
MSKYLYMAERRQSMRNIRGVEKLEQYLIENEVPIGQTTLYKLVREKEIPHIRISSRVLVFNLDSIDSWLQKEVS